MKQRVNNSIQSSIDDILKHTWPRREQDKSFNDETERETKTTVKINHDKEAKQGS